MATIIRDFPGANFPGSLIFNLEPAVVFPSSILGAYRLRSSFESSSVNRQGPWPPCTEGTTGVSEYLRTSVRLTGKQFVVRNVPFPADFVTMMMVVQQGVSSQNAFIAGVSEGVSSTDRTYGLYAGSNGTSYTVRYGTGGAITMPSVGGERWEMICACINRTNGQMRLYRPRTNTVVDGAFTALTDPTAQYEILGRSGNSSFPGPVNCAWSIHLNAYLDATAMDQIYTDVKNSLAVSLVEI